LLPRAQVWNVSSESNILTSLIPRTPYVVPAITIISPLELRDTPCPVNEDNRDSWTAAQRREAEENRIVAKDLNHLQEFVNL